MKEVLKLKWEQYPEELFNNLLDTYKEAMAHALIECLGLTEELAEKNNPLKKIYNDHSRKIYQSLPKEEQENITFMMKFFLVYEAANKGHIPNHFRRLNLKDPTSKQKVLQTYKEYLSDCDSLYKDGIKFTDDLKFDEHESLNAIKKIYQMYYDALEASKNAESTKKVYLEAFEYALSSPHVGAREIKEINRILNFGDTDEEAYFKVVMENSSKEETAMKIADLLYGYQTNYEIGDIIELHENTKRKMRHTWLYQKMLREAKMHIDFIKINPFGNTSGMVALIILNCNLLRQGIAPIIITDEIYAIYQQYIYEHDYDALAKCFVMLSTSLQSLWASELKKNLGFNRHS